MTNAALSLDTIRHRLLEGVLLRLTRQPDASAFILRGGMLMRHWLRPLPRPAGDLDLVATFSGASLARRANNPGGYIPPVGSKPGGNSTSLPTGTFATHRHVSPTRQRGAEPGDFIEETARRFFLILADQTINDGVIFDLERTRTQGIWLETAYPGVRIFTSGVMDGTEVDFNVDITSGPYPRPAPVFGMIPTECGEDTRLWMCRPETVVAQKMQALCHLGMLSWRPKDLNDLRLLLIRVPMEDAALREGIAAYMADLGRTTADARAMFGPSSWWSMKLSSARWFDFAKASREQGVPSDLAAVVAQVAGRLVPVLEGLP